MVNTEQLLRFVAKVRNECNGEGLREEAIELLVAAGWMEEEED